MPEAAGPHKVTSTAAIGTTRGPQWPHSKRKPRQAQKTGVTTAQVIQALPPVLIQTKACATQTKQRKIRTPFAPGCSASDQRKLCTRINAKLACADQCTALALHPKAEHTVMNATAAPKIPSLGLRESAT